MKSSNYFVENFIILLIISSMFFPTISLGIDIRFDDFMSLLLIPFIISIRPNFKVNRLLVSYFIILILIFISTIYGYIFLSIPISLRDFNEIIRMVKPFLIIIAVSYCDSDKLLKSLHAFFIYGALFVITIAFLEYFDVLGYRKLTSILYQDERFQDLNRTRAILTTGNPNIAAALILFFIIYTLQTILLTQRKLLNSILLFFLLIALLMPSSRTSLVVFAIILFVSLVFHFKQNKILSIVIFVFCFLILILLINQFQYLTIGFSTFSEGTNTSMIQRYKQWTIAFELFSKSPWIGWGPAKDVHSTMVDNEHLLLLRRYGIIGYLSIFYFLFGYAWVVIRNRSKLKKIDVFYKRMALTSIFSCLLIFIIMITNNFFSGYQLMPLYAVMITIIENKLKTI